ncbi:hypothetical protein [Paraburkholderia sp.]|uniref:hypothetical protein n=1 Tax=Paraburkholderia sp. TaxID=1926495 RepID=UPI0025CCF999|nr:hypothetical protein [Paraburkholderia sp.]
MTVFDRPENVASQIVKFPELMNTVLVIQGARIILIESKVAKTPNITDRRGFTWSFGIPQRRSRP